MSKRLILFYIGFIVSIVAAQEPEYVGYTKDIPNSLFVCDIKGQIQQTALEFDSKDIAHVLFTNKETDDLWLYYTNNESGRFSDPAPLLLMDTGCKMMESKIGPDDALHLVWQDEFNPTSQPAKGWIRYLKILDGAILSNLVLFQHPEGACNISFDLDRLGNVYVVADLAEQIAHYWDYQTVFARVIDGQVQDPIIRRLHDKKNHYAAPIIHVTDTDIIYILLRGWGLLLLKYQDGNFTEPVLITNKSLSTLYSATMISDQTGDIHVYYIKYLSDTLLHTKSEDCGNTFLTPDHLVEGVELQFVSQPIILPDNTPLVVKRSKFVPYGDDYSIGYYQLDRGYGYGNPIEFDGEYFGSRSGNYSDINIEPQVRKRSGFGLSALIGNIYKNDQKELFSKLNIDNYKLQQLDKPHVLITSNAASIYGLGKNYIIRIAMDIYNPLPELLEADLAIMMQFKLIQDDVYYFFSIDGDQPMLTTDYRAMRVSIPPGQSFQNLPFLEFNTDMLYGIIVSVDWHFYVGLIDPETRLPLGDITHTHAKISLPP